MKRRRSGGKIPTGDPRRGGGGGSGGSGEGDVLESKLNIRNASENGLPFSTIVLISHQQVKGITTWY